MKGEREVAGLRCSEVLADLGDYLDGELSPSRKATIDAHLSGCDICERFGGEYAGVVRALKASASPALDDEPDEDDGAFDRLARRLEEAGESS